MIFQALGARYGFVAAVAGQHRDSRDQPARRGRFQVGEIVGRGAHDANSPMIGAAIGPSASRSSGFSFS